MPNVSELSMRFCLNGLVLVFGVYIGVHANWNMAHWKDHQQWWTPHQNNIFLIFCAQRSSTIESLAISYQMRFLHMLAYRHAGNCSYERLSNHMKENSRPYTYKRIWLHRHEKYVKCKNTQTQEVTFQKVCIFWKCANL